MDDVQRCAAADFAADESGAQRGYVGVVAERLPGLQRFPDAREMLRAGRHLPPTAHTGQVGQQGFKI